jgi:hypothetical protein
MRATPGSAETPTSRQRRPRPIAIITGAEKRKSQYCSKIVT